jgi:hypothetical protein
MYDTLVKRLNKKTLLDSIIQKEKKLKRCYKGQKAAAKKDSLLNEKGAYSRGDYEASNTQNQIRFLLVY